MGAPLGIGHANRPAKTVRSNDMRQRTSRQIAVARQLVDVGRSLRAFDFDGQQHLPRTIDAAMKEAERAFSEDDYDRAEHLAKVIERMIQARNSKVRGQPEEVYRDARELQHVKRKPPAHLAAVLRPAEVARRPAAARHDRAIPAQDFQRRARHVPQGRRAGLQPGARRPRQKELQERATWCWPAIYCVWSGGQCRAMTR